MPTLPGAAEIAGMLGHLGMEIELDLAERVQRYLELLQRWNARLNLTGLREPQSMVETLFGESFWAARLLSQQPGPLLDVGSGAGFPGLALKLARPQLRCYLLEPRQKRAAFLATVRRELELKEVEIFTKTLENCDIAEWTEPPGIITLRGVKLSPRLGRQMLARLRPGGQVLLFSTEKLRELDQAALPGLKWNEPVRLPWSREKVLLLGSGGIGSTWNQEAVVLS